MLFHLLHSGKIIVETTSPDECICSVLCKNWAYGNSLFDKLNNTKIKKKVIEKALGKSVQSKTKGQRLLYKLQYLLMTFPPENEHDVALYF